MSTPVGVLGSGRGGGVERTLEVIVTGLLAHGHCVTVLAPEGSVLTSVCRAATLWTERGREQPSWQHRSREAPIEMPAAGLLPRMWQRALQEQSHFEVILNMAYDWLPFWLTPYTATPLCHLVSMGSVSEAMDEVIATAARIRPGSLAFHSAAQAEDFHLPAPARQVGNGFDLSRYQFEPEPEAVLGWAGRITPEKGLEDAAAVAVQLGLPLRVWGVSPDRVYAAAVEASVPPGTIEWRGFLDTEVFQKELGRCAVFLNTPKWNEAFGNVVVEAMACGVPVATYARGGPGELVKEEANGALAPADDVAALAVAITRAYQVPRAACRAWAETHHSLASFVARIEAWLQEYLQQEGLRSERVPPATEGC